MESFRELLLYLLTRFNGERTPAAIYHLLKGKKSAQTLHDARLFRVEHYFCFWPTLSRRSFDEQMEQLLAEQFVTTTYKVTESGRQLLATVHDLTRLDGLSYDQGAFRFWRKFSLAVQVYSEFRHQNDRYEPIQRDRTVLQAVKLFWRQAKALDGSGSLFVKEVEEAMATLCNDEALVLVYKLTGASRVGWTMGQLAQRLGTTEFVVYCRWLMAIHQLLRTVELHRDRFPLLSLLVPLREYGQGLTQSARATWSLLANEHTIEQLANKRQLKPSTIEDHLVEIAQIDANFSIRPYVTEAEEEAIKQICRQTGQRKLAEIKQHVQLPYFQIRLVIAKFGGELWSSVRF